MWAGAVSLPCRRSRTCVCARETPRASRPDIVTCPRCKVKCTGHPPRLVGPYLTGSSPSLPLRLPFAPFPSGWLAGLVNQGPARTGNPSLASLASPGALHDRSGKKETGRGASHVEHMWLTSSPFRPNVTLSLRSTGGTALSLVDKCMRQAPCSYGPVPGPVCPP